MKLYLLCVAAVTALGTEPTQASKIPPQPHGHRGIKTHVINLDLAPEHRYDAIVPFYNESVWEFWNDFFANDDVVRDAMFALADIRGAYNTEMQGEIQGLADVSGLPLKFVESIQMLYELNTLMVPVVNFTQFPNAIYDPVPEKWQSLMQLPWRGPGCTGIIARDSSDGTVYHARNLDFQPLSNLQPLVYNGIFQRNGTELFRSQMVAGYVMPITAARMGSDGFAIERNTRYTDHEGGNEEMLDNLLKDKRELNGWQLRKILENNETFDDAIASIKSVDYTSTEYTIVSGVQKGQIISRNPDNVAFVQELGKHNVDEPDEYIIMTNFDFFFDDIREVFDPTAGKAGHPTRRETAQTILNASIPTGINSNVLFEAINAQGVIADTIFQAIINIEKGIWNISQPLI
jgi:hypothetical protein